MQLQSQREQSLGTQIPRFRTYYNCSWMSILPAKSQWYYLLAIKLKYLIFILEKYDLKYLIH